MPTAETAEESAVTAGEPEAVEAALQESAALSEEQVVLGEVALLLASRGRPRVSLERYRHHLSLLVRDTADLARSFNAEESLNARCEALNEVIRGRYGYEGDSLTYDNLQNANLMRVIDRRKGLPVALSILYLHTAEAQGWSVTGLNFPAHFLLALSKGAERVLLDPFNDGRILTTADLRALLKRMTGAEAELRPEHTRPLSKREVLLRLQNNIKVRLLAEGRLDKARPVLDSMLMLMPGDPRLWYEAGTLQAKLENLGAAILAFEKVLALEAPAPLKHEAARLLQSLKGRLN